MNKCKLRYYRVMGFLSIFSAVRRIRLTAIETKLVDAPKMEVVDEVKWERCRRDHYGYRDLIPCVERWARLMQLEMLQGKKLIDVVAETSKEADIQNELDVCFELAVYTLCSHWKYGEELNRLYTGYRWW